MNGGAFTEAIKDAFSKEMREIYDKCLGEICRTVTGKECDPDELQSNFDDLERFLGYYGIKLFKSRKTVSAFEKRCLNAIQDRFIEAIPDTEEAVSVVHALVLSEYFIKDLEEMIRASYKLCPSMKIANKFKGRHKVNEFYERLCTIFSGDTVIWP